MDADIVVEDACEEELILAVENWRLCPLKNTLGGYLSIGPAFSEIWVGLFRMSCG